MTTVPIKDAKNRFSELGRAAQDGETITITRNGKPAFVIAPVPKKKGGIDWEAGEAYKRKHGITKFFGYVAPDFDDPLPEDFLIKPLPDKFFATPRQEPVVKPKSRRPRK